MPKDLGDVLHFFLPETEEAKEEPGPSPRSGPGELPTLVLPVGDRDVLRAALAWNLGVEIARRGSHATLVTRESPQTALLWPHAGRGPVGAEVVHAPADDLATLGDRARDLSLERASEAADGGVVIVCVPPSWLQSPDAAADWLRWVLLFSTPERRELMATYALAKRVLRAQPDASIGVTLHGVRSVEHARRAFERVARAAVRHVGRSPVSYGLLVDDLQVYRAIVARRPIGLEHPQSPAARALGDVARLILEDARSDALT